MTVHLTRARTRYARPWGPVLTALILIIGVLCAWFLTVRADREMRENLLARTQLVAGAVNLERIQALTGTEADLESPEYLRLKEQFAAIRAAEAQCRFIYLMGRKADGTVFFFVDSEPAGSEDESPAGMIYGDAPDAFHRVFSTGVAAVEGPFTDSWGTFVSGAVPVTGPQTGAVLAVLAMDIEVRDWRWNVAGQAILPVGLAVLALIAIVFAGAHLLARRARTETPPRWMWHLEPALFVAVGLVLTLFAAWLAQEASNRNQAGAFRHLAESRTAAFAEVLRSLRDIEIEGLAKFYENSERVTDEKFQDFTRFLTRNLAIQAWGWAPAVSSNEKDRFEQAARAAGMDGFIIWERDAEDHRIPADGRDVYYPVFRATPEEVGRPVIGFDLGSDLIRRQALDEALRTGFPTATEPVRLQESGRPLGMLVFRPVFADAVSRQPRGIALAVLRLEVALQVVSVESVMGTELLLIRGDQSMEALASSWAADITPNETLSFQRPVLAFGKTFLVTAYAGPDFLRAQPARGGLITALLGLCLTAVVAVVVSLVLRRRQVLEGLVRERTAALREERLRLANILKGTNVATWEWNVRTGEHVINDRWAEIIGYALEELEPITIRTWENVVHPDDQKTTNELLKSHFTGREPYFDCEYRMRHKRGHWVWVQDRGQVVSRTQEGKPLMMYGTLSDITERKHAENEVSSINSQLQKANAEKDMLFSIIAHDLKSPMSGLLASTELLAHQPDIFSEKEIRRLSTELHKNARNTFELMEDLLQWARMSQGGIDYAPKACSLNEVVSEGLSTAQDLAKSKEITIRQDIEPGLTVLIDQSMIKTVIRNILFNAIKFTPRRGEIVITARQEEQKATVSVQDNGIGMNEQVLSSVFTLEKGKRQLGTEGEKGTGLGLMLCKQFIEQHGGHIWAESEPGKGTTVFFTLPTQETRTP